jgi:2-keto-3-deoxy-L-rhamnonate aldolase RhmA
MADAGFDWLCIDLEHSVIDYFEAEQLIATMEAKGCIPYVRVGENNPLIIKRMLDAGAVGIIVPAVNSKEDAIRAVKSVKYPPLGNRGVGLARAQNYGFGFDEYVEKINSRTIVIVQIEHIDAINTLEFDSYYVIQPAHPWWDNLDYLKINGGKKVEDGFSYSSGNNTHWLTIEELKKMIANL